MTNLGITTLIAALVSQTAACVITSDGGYGDGGDGGGVDIATISAHWSLRNLANGATTACPVGFDTVELFALPIDANGNAVADPQIDLFDCDARAGISTDLFPDVYQVWIEVRSHDLEALYAQSLSQVLDLRLVDQSFSADVLNDGGYFQLSWDLVSTSTNRPLDCAQVPGIDSILAVSTSVADAHLIYEDQRVCEDHFGVSEGLLQGTYTITVEAMAGERSLGPATTLTNQTIEGRNRVTDLGAITIPIGGL